MSPPMKIDPVLLCEMWRAGVLVADIASVFGVSKPAVSKMARTCGLEPRKPRTTKAVA